MNWRKLTQFTQILPNLYLTSYWGLKKTNLIKYNIKCVVNVTRLFPFTKLDGVETYRIQLNDKPHVNIGGYFEYAGDIISRAHSKGQNVAVHCQAGRSRSATIVIAYLMRHKGVDLYTAYNLVKTKRPIIKPNLGFVRQLIEYESKIFGQNTVELVKIEEKPKTKTWFLLKKRL